jgi:hypothetical protein
MPRKIVKKGGNGFLPLEDNYTLFYQTLLLNPNISTQPLLDQTFKEIGIIHKTTSVSKNIIMEYKSDLYNIFGATPNSDNKFFSSPWNLCLSEIMNDLKNYEYLEPTKIFKIANLKFDFIAIDKNSLTVIAYGTLLCKNKIQP